MTPKPSTFRLSEDTLSRLDQLAALTGLSRAGYIAHVINRDFQVVSNNPQLDMMLSDLSDIRSRAQALIDEESTSTGL